MFFSTKPILGIQGFSQVLVVLVGSSQKTRRKFKIMLIAKGSAKTIISLQCRKLCEISHFFVSIRKEENQKKKFEILLPGSRETSSLAADPR
jgi:hypothetical protein